MELTQRVSGDIQITSQVLNTPMRLSIDCETINVKQVINAPLSISTTCETIKVTQTIDTFELKVHHTLVYEVNPWWTEFVTAYGTFVLSDGKIMMVLTE